MEKWIISELTSFFDSLKTSFIEKIKKTYKLRKIKRELKKSIDRIFLGYMVTKSIIMILIVF